MHELPFEGSPEPPAAAPAPRDLYRIAAWGLGHFRVAPDGNLRMRPDLDAPQEIDLKVLVDDLQRRGLDLPVLLRFTDLVRSRIDALVAAFERAIEDYEYKGSFRGVYPVKVNQQRQLVEEVARFSRPHHLGFEAGSKPELMVALALLDDPDALVVCNGYKDPAYIEMALLARKIGRNTIIVIEKYSELEHVLAMSKRLDIQPILGIRAKLSTTGAGRWKASVGDRAKFGLTVPEIIGVVERLKAMDGALDTLQLLHFHIGSQVSAIRAIKNALREAMRIFTELHRMGAGMRYLDVGGGLGVDYDGSRTTSASSMNYDVQEYANDVIAASQAGCDEADVPHPTIVTEAGRFMVTHSSALVFGVVGMTGPVHEQVQTRDEATGNEHLLELWDVYDAISPTNLQEPFHDAVEIREEVTEHFKHRLCSLSYRADVDRLFWAVCAKLSEVMQHARDVPAELLPIQRSLAHTYFCNFSLFQSAPDSWAINQLFPVCPIHRLNEPPSVRGVLADITCDSDGKVDRFIGRTVKPVLELHPLDDQPYYLGMFLVGSYQEILGDLHNLFGDTHIVHVSVADTPLGYRIDHVVEGDTIKEVLQYVEFDRQGLVARIRHAIERAIEGDACSMEDGRRLVEAYARELEGYTYLDPK